MKGKILNKARLVKPFGLEHLALESIDLAKRSGTDGISSRKIIKLVNDPKNPLTEISRTSNEITNGAVYGTLSRLKGKGLVKKVLISKQNGEELAYKITAKGSKELREIIVSTQNAINDLDTYQPDLVGI